MSTLSLSGVRDYLRTHPRASEHALALHFGSDPHAVRAALDQWQRRGRLRTLAAACPHACGCAGTCAALYEWIE